jgi:hypothetical protein
MVDPICLLIPIGRAFLTPPARLMAVADSAADLLQRIIGFQAEGILACGLTVGQHYEGNRVEAIFSSRGEGA